PVLEGNLAALQRAKLSQCLSRLRAAALPPGPRSTAALLSLRVQRYGRLHRGDTDSATNKHRSLASQIVSAAACGLLHCMSLELALFGREPMSALRLLLRVIRTSSRHRRMTDSDPTRTS